MASKDAAVLLERAPRMNSGYGKGGEGADAVIPVWVGDPGLGGGWGNCLGRAN